MYTDLYHLVFFRILECWWFEGPWLGSAVQSAQALLGGRHRGKHALLGPTDGRRFTKEDQRAAGVSAEAYTVWTVQLKKDTRPNTCFLLSYLVQDTLWLTLRNQTIFFRKNKTWMNIVIGLERKKTVFGKCWHTWIELGFCNKLRVLLDNVLMCVHRNKLYSCMNK